MNLPTVVPKIFAVPASSNIARKPVVQSFIALLFVSLVGCGGGGSASSDPIGAAVDGGGDNTQNPDGGGGDNQNPDGGEQPTPVVVNSDPVIGSFVATVSPDDALAYTLAWQITDADDDEVSCTVDPGGGLAAQQIDDCIATSQILVNYSSDGEVTASLAADDGVGGAASAEIVVSVSSPVTLSGVVTSYPDAADTPASDGSSIILSDADGDANSLSRQDMAPAEALVSLFLITDVDFADPIATVKTDSQGRYEVTASDVREYLLANGAVDATSTDADIIAAFRDLGRLQVRALIVNERDGQSQALAIQTIADPSNVDENGAPVPVAVDPITHRVVKAIVDQIRESVSSLEAMGLPPAVVTELLDTVISTVVVEIDRVLEETADDLIDIPQGQTVADVVEMQEQELVVDLEADDVSLLSDLLESDTDEIEEQALSDLESNVLSAEVVIDESQSNLQGSLDSESQGLLSGLEATISENVTDTVELRIAEAQQAGTDEALTEIFGERDEGADFQQLVANAEAENERVQRRSLQRFFLSLGLAVVVEENDAADAGIVAVKLQLPDQLDGAALPGAAGFDERNIRLFKVGDGALDADSHFTDDPFAPLGALDDDGNAMPPFQYVPRLADVLAEVTGTAHSDELQMAIDEAWLNINAADRVPGEADFQLVDRIAMLNELDERLRYSTLVSTRVIDGIVEARDASVNIKRLASVIADHFQWVSEDVNLTPEGFPIFSDRRGPLRGGANVVDSSELIRALSFTLGDTATQTAQVLTRRASFYAQYAAEAIDAAIQSATLANNGDLDFGSLLLDIYPAQASGYRDLILGVDDADEGAYAYLRARDRVASGLTAALPRELYGQTLTSESELPMRAALFLLDYVLNGNYLIDATDGYFVAFDIVDANGELNTRFVPHYNNLKQLEPTGEISVATIVSSLLSVTEIDDGEFFNVAVAALFDGLGEIPVLPEFREYDIDEIDSGLGERVNRVDVSCTVERFDGLDPDQGADHDRLQMSVFGVEYVPETGEFIKGERIDAAISSEPSEFDGALRRTYRIEQLSALNGAEYGRDYVVRLEIDGYQHELPELFFYVDGYVPSLDLCPLDAPLYIGPDQQFEHVPGLGLISDQSRPGLNGDELEGIDVSNFEVPGAPLYVTRTEESAGQGRADLNFVSGPAGFSLVAAEGSDTAFAPLFGHYVNGELQLALSASADGKPLSGMQSILGQNLRALVEDVVADSSLLSASIDVAVGELEPERLYLMRDADGRFWVLEVRYADVFTDFDGSAQAFIDLGVASVNSIGEVVVPDVSFDEAVAEPYDAGAGITYHRLYYGDWLVLENPNGYDGPELLPAEQLSFDSAADYAALEAAADGVVIRYAGVHFDENIQIFEDLDTVFGVPPDYSSVPVRLDAGRQGLTFVKLGFSIQDKRYLMEPAPQDAGRYTDNLSHNDLIAIFDSNSDDDGPVYLGRVIRDLPADDPYAHFEIGLEMIRFDVIDDDFEDFDEREVVCFEEDDRSCPQDYPELAFASDVGSVVGIVYDRDFDGLPALFDPNDNDPNIPGQLPGSIDEPGGQDYDLLDIHAIAESSSDGELLNALVVETRNLYPGEVERISLAGALFGDASAEQVIVLCSAGQQTDTGYFEPFDCQPQGVAGGVEVALGSVSDFDLNLALLLPDDARDALGSHVTIEYSIGFQQPVGPDGQALFCGDAECPSRPDASGLITVALPDDLPVISDLSLDSGGETSSAAEISTLDVSRDLRFFGAAVPNAVEYELSMVCSATGDQAEYLPEEHFQIYAPAHDATGQAVAPEFYFHAPWLAGRICDLTLRAAIVSDAGDLLGFSVFTRDDIVTTEFLSPGYVDNEIDLFPGQSLCIADDGLHLHADACSTEQLLFNYDGPLSVTNSGLATVQLTTGPLVHNAHIESQQQPVLQGRVLGDAFIAFNTDENPNDFLPTCGFISTDETSYSCATDSPLQDAFVASPDLTELALLPHLQDLGLQVLGALNENGNISLLDSGEYWLQVPETDELLEIYVEVFLEADIGEHYVYVHFQRQGLAPQNTDAAAVEAVVPGFAYIEHNGGFAADIELRHLDGDILRIAWYLLDGRAPLNGFHDLDGDGIEELFVTEDAGVWFFEFSEALDSVQEFGSDGPFQLTRDSDGRFRTVLDSQGGVVEFILRMAGTEYIVAGEVGVNGAYFDVLSEYTFDTTAEMLFDGLPSTHYFPTGMTIASPFANDADGASAAGTGFGVFLSDEQFVCSDGTAPQDGQCADGLPPFDPTIAPDTGEPFPLAEPVCSDGTLPLDDGICADGSAPFPTAGTAEPLPDGDVCPDGSLPIDGNFCETPIPQGESPTGFCPDNSIPVDGQCADGQTPEFPVDADPFVPHGGDCPDEQVVTDASGVVACLDPTLEPDFPFPTEPDPIAENGGAPSLGDELLIEYDPLSIRGANAIRSDAERIARVLAGRIQLADMFHAGALTAGARNATCFGPSLAYQNHPDAAERADDFGELPGGDLGIWSDFDAATGQACAAAQMNEQLSAARQRTFTGLLTMAATVRQLQPGEQQVLLDGGSVDVTGRMQALGVPAVIFLNASVARDFDSGIWTYSASMQVFGPDFDEARSARIHLVFDPADADVAHDYSGLLQISADAQHDGGNCADSSVRHLSSLAFQRTSREALRTEHRYAMFCGHATDIENGFGSDGRVDPSYSNQLFDDGWGNNFSMFSANFNPADNAGSYAYSWQAGAGDSHARILNVSVGGPESLQGDAWFGYGENLQNAGETAGSINGFICNWAGPGASHELLERAQYQSLTWDETASQIVVGEGGSGITFAPTNACVYDSDDGGSFLYDRNLNGDLTDESSQSVDVGAGEVLAFDLVPQASSAFAGIDIEELIAARGYQRPLSPVTPVP